MSGGEEDVIVCDLNHDEATDDLVRGIDAIVISVTKTIPMPTQTSRSTTSRVAFTTCYGQLPKPTLNGS